MFLPHEWRKHTLEKLLAAENRYASGQFRVDSASTIKATLTGDANYGLHPQWI